MDEKIVKTILHEALNFAAMVTCKVEVKAEYDEYGTFRIEIVSEGVKEE